MSNKRFVYEEEYFPITLMQIRDTSNNETYDLEDACELLNEQQLVISRLDEHNTGYIVENLTLKKENEQLRQFINKGRRLSVKELMDNANENELLKKKIRVSEKENENLESNVRFLKNHLDKIKEKLIL